MKQVTRVAIWVVGIFLFFLFLGWGESASRKNCEERIAQQLNTTAVYIHGRCLVKGYGNAGGR